MTERIDEWPRVHTCLYDWCPQRNDECQRCDAVVKIIRDARAKRQAEATQALLANTGKGD